MASTARLYSPEVLGLATRLAAYPLSGDLPLRADARSPACGSRIELGLATDASGAIVRIGLKAQACAIGQAAAAIFAEAATGRSMDDIDGARDALQRWLAGEGLLPDWPGLAAIAPARDFPGRHGAIMLSWNAASQALSSTWIPR